MSELKEQALLERIGELTVQYEDKIANLRVELTKMAQAASQTAERIKQLEELTVEKNPEVVVSNVVE